MENNKILKNKQMYNYILLIFIAIILMIPIFLVKKEYIGSRDDEMFHIRRLYDVFLNLKQGTIKGYMNENLIYGLGYPTNGFYPEIFLIPFSCLLFLDISLTHVFYIFLVAINIATILVAYNCALKYYLSDSKALLFAIIYTVYPFRLNRFYFHMDIGAQLAYIFFPLVFLGFFYILKLNKKGNTYLSIGMIFIVFSHLQNVFLVSGVLIVIFIWYLALNFKNITKKDFLMIIKNLFTSAIIVIISTTIIWLPIIEFLLSDNFYFQHNIYDIMNVNSGLLLINNYPITIKVIIFFILFIGFGIINLKFKDIYFNYFYIFLLLFFINTDFFPWHAPIIENIYSFIRFPFRFWYFGGIFLGLFINDEKIISYKKATIICLFAFITMFFIESCTAVLYNRLDRNPLKVADESPIFNFYAAISLCDYIPDNLVFNEKIYYPLCDKIQEKILDENIDIEYKINDINNFYIRTTNENIVLPKIYYIGYTVYYDNKKMKYTKDETGYIHVFNEDGFNGNIMIKYTGTSIQKFSKVISLISFLFIIFCLIKNKRKY